MREYSVKRPLKRPPVHPDELLREEVITDMALRIGKLAGNGPGLWLRMQQAYDLWHTERQMEDELSKIEPVVLVGSDA